MAIRVGVGSDIHRLVAGSGIRLGGVTIPCDFACVAVSDGDVVLHALVDALLGAAALGDIGDRYPESRVQSGEDSRRFVREVMDDLTARGVRVTNVDCIIELERPRLASWKTPIGNSMAELLRLTPGRVNVKAKTAEGLGAVGRSEALCAQVIVVLDMPEEEPA